MLSSAFLHTVFLLLLAFYVCVQAALCICEVRSTEKAAGDIPQYFRKRLTLAEHRKAVDYTAEVIQSDLVNALVGAAIALLLTVAGGLTWLLAGLTTIWGPGLITQFILVLMVTLMLALIDIPLTWWRNFRINERYGYERTNADRWMSRYIRQTFVGWLTELPLLFIIVLFLNVTSYWWWLAAFAATLVWVIWYFCFAGNRLSGFGKNARPFPEGQTRSAVEKLLAEFNLRDTSILLADHVPNVRKDSVVILRSLFSRKLVVFSEAFERLSREELLSLTARAASRSLGYHNVILATSAVVLAFFFWRGFAWLTEQPEFFDALGILPDLAISEGVALPGLIVVLLITLIPIVLYPLVFPIHAFTRFLEFSADEAAVHRFGKAAFVSAMVKLYDDYRNTLTPNRFYSLANHLRPHVTQRIENAVRFAAFDAASRKKSHEALSADRSAQFNAIMQKRAAVRAQSEARTLLAAKRHLTEAQTLRNRTKTHLES